MINNIGEGEKVPKSFKGWVILIMTIALPTLGAIYIELLRENHEIKMHEIENTHMQQFNCETISIEKFGIKYVDYKITTTPIVKGFHIIAYPYLVYETEKKVYIPVTGLFTQNEYVADEKGCCTLSRENVFEDLKEMINKMYMVDFPFEIKCLVAIKYVEQDEERKEVYDIKDGQLTKSEPGNAIGVLEAWEDEKSLKIEMTGWPDYNRKNLDAIFS